MAGKVLQIQVVVDENGQARRALSDLEGGVKKVDTAAKAATPAVASLDEKMADWDKRIASLTQSIDAHEAATSANATSVLGMNAALSGALAAAGAAGAAIYALGNYVKDATEYYVEQSGVLEINRQSVDDLTKSWDLIKYAIGEVVVGGAGDYRSWIQMVNVGLIEMGVHLAADIEFYKELAKFGAEAAVGGPSVNPFDAGAPPGIDTTMKNPDGSLTPYGQMVKQRGRKPNREPTWGDINGDPMSGATAERITNEEISRQKREQLELERQQKQEAAERLRLSNEQAKLENDLTEALSRSRAQYEAEIHAAELLNRTKQQSLDLSLRDKFIKDGMSEGQGQAYDINVSAERKIAAVDPRASNAQQLIRAYQAERELALIQMRQTSEGFTQGIADDLNHFRAIYADVIGQLPATFAEAIPPVIAASRQMRDALTADLDSIGARTEAAGSSFMSLGTNVRASYEEIAAGLRRADEAYQNAGIIVHPDMFVSRLRSQQTGGLLYASGGVVEPRHYAGGGAAGTDTVPAWLTPGEGVLSRTGMSALDRLNSGSGIGGRRPVSVTIEKGAIDARGAQFSDEASLDALVEKMSAKLSAIADRIGAA